MKKALSKIEIEALVSQGCAAQDWSTISKKGSCDLTLFKNVNFSGEIILSEIYAQESKSPRPMNVLYHALRLFRTAN